jgi:single-stranded-DNA-specific exonuclease
MMARIVAREVPAQAYRTLLDAGFSPALARVFAARGIDRAERLHGTLDGLLAIGTLHNCERAAGLLAQAIEEKKKLLVVGDYDADGATSCALAVSVLQSFGARAEYLVPNRFEFGYGLTPEIVELAAQRAPDWIITVDNGISSVEGVAAANRRGIQVLVTDHHLAPTALPAAACIVNPNQPACSFASKHLAGVGVMFYVLAALRAELRRRGTFAGLREPNLGQALDLVALGTVADVARLDDNNRTLVAHGLRRIQAGRARPGIEALYRVAGRETARASAYDLAFVLGPRLNAAGRLTDMSLGIECLLAADPGRATELAQELDRLNRERRDIESAMHDAALTAVESVSAAERYSLCLYEDGWHQGVVGILASRLRERMHCPVFVFAPGMGDEAKGSGRSIPALHLRDALDRLDKLRPGLLRRFGGHAGAAGVSLAKADIGLFADAFEQVVRELLTPADLDQVIETDGPLGIAQANLQLAEGIESQVWGHGFPAPAFCDEFNVVEQRVVGGRHLRLRLRQGAGGTALDGICFGEETAALPDRVQAVYRLQVSRYNGLRSPEIVVEHWRPI